MSAFVRRYSQRIAAFICTIRGHSWQRWSYNRVAQTRTHKCRRCERTETEPFKPLTPLARKRNANSADTITKDAQ